jgi:hypothetical protein
MGTILINLLLRDLGLLRPSQQVSQSWVNGRSSFEKIYSYYLVPNQKEILQSSRLLLNIMDRYIRSSKITVTAAVEQPRDPNDTSISVDDNLYLIADISKTC